MAAAAAVEVAGTWTAPSSSRATQPRHCAQAWGWVEIRRTSARRVPGTTASTKATGTTTSPTMTSGSGDAASVSIVALTPPSTEFSIGTTA